MLASSSVYETEPVGLVLDQRDFFNACLRIETAHEPEQLLDACKDGSSGTSAASPAASATARGRSTSTCCCSGRWSTARERLTLPHPEVLARRFVLVPLLELDPELTLPGGERAADALDGACRGAGGPPGAASRCSSAG